MLKSGRNISAIIYYSFFALLLCFSSNLNAQTENYKIARGDVLDIMVMEHPEFSIKNIIVLPDGNVQFPALGFVKAAGKSPIVLSDTLQSKLIKYVVDPIVTVYVRQINNQYVNILGGVNKPGQYQIYEPIKVMSAISLAGGFRDVKKIKSISIIRVNGEREKLKVDDFMETPDIFDSLKPGDTIYIEPKKEFNWYIVTTVTSVLTLVLSVISLTN